VNTIGILKDTEIDNEEEKTIIDLLIINFIFGREIEAGFPNPDT